MSGTAGANRDRPIERKLAWAGRTALVIGAMVALAPTRMGAMTGPLHGPSSPQTSEHSAAGTRAKETVLKDELLEMRQAIDHYSADRKGYPRNLASLVNAGYITKVPIDPFTTANTSWHTVQSKAESRHLAVARGIYDVRSGSKDTALDGTKYSDW